MTWIDIVFLIPAAWFGYRGLKNGLVYELASVLALILGVWATVRFSGVLATKLGDSQTYKVIAFVLIFVAVLVAVHFAGQVVEKFIKLLIPGAVNNIVGLLFGVFKVMIVFSVIFMFVAKVDKKEVIIKPDTKEKSFSYKYIEPVAPFLSDWCKKEFNKNENAESVDENADESKHESKKS